MKARLRREALEQRGRELNEDWRKAKRGETAVEARLARMDRAAKAKQTATEKELEEAGQLVSRFVIARSECQNCSHTTATMRFYRAALGMTRQCPICRRRTLKLVARKEGER